MKIIWTLTLLMIPGAMTLSLTGHSGGEINITCTYQDRHTGNAKYFCKVLWLKCSDLIKTKEKDKWVNSGRFFLYDDTGAAVFTVIFRNLSEQDSGKYKCGVDKLGIDSYTEVNLNVITAPKTVSVSSPSPSTTTSSSSSITTPPISLNSQPSTSDFTLDSPSVSNGLCLIIVVSVVLPLLIAGLVSCIVTVCMKRQARAKGSDSASKMPEPGTENSKAVPQTLYIYEGIKDTRTAQLPTNPSDSTKTVYATAQLPTNPSGSITTVYSTPQLPTNPSVEWHKQCKNQLTTNPSASCYVYATPGLPTTPSDSTKTVYATPQLPTTPSDSTKTVYATPQLPTTPSDSTNTVYANV
uniref:Ig-like domain-containing protein n=1 Tax=Cyprinus carpio carpio TaxID=630221 RepID=A0A9J7ZA49_CYPCA